MMRKSFWSISIALSLCLIFSFIRQQPDSKAKTLSDNPMEKNGVLHHSQLLPVTKILLFNSGVGHFTRSGEIQGDARVDLTFSEQDVNDLIKSMVLEDSTEQGKISAITYDSREPLDRTLKSYSINLNGSPSFAKILSQARGEKIEVTLLTNAAGQPGSLQGAIIGIEEKEDALKDKVLKVEYLNLWCQEGMRTVRILDIARIRFSNPELENEMRRALDTLAHSHDAQKKVVSLHFTGEGKRKINVGYVVENPIWKTSYRLVLPKKGNPFLQGWAVVENSTDEDWNQIKIGLISGRPISFNMDMYNPLYIVRPIVEPELFAGLRPPTYDNSFMNDRWLRLQKNNFTPQLMNSAGGIVGMAGGMMGMAGNLGNFNQNQLQIQNNQITQNNIALQGRLNQNGQVKGIEFESMDVGRIAPSAAIAEQFGDSFVYQLKQPISLPRQKSALLPIINKEITGSRVSIFRSKTRTTHPQLGIRFRNTSDMNLAQGPITVFDGSAYAGDTRILEVQKNESRLVSYALDLGTEIIEKPSRETTKITKVSATKGVLYSEQVTKEIMTYQITNRSDHDRNLLIEYPNRKNVGFHFVGDNTKPDEETPKVFRFLTAVKAGEKKNYVIEEEFPQVISYQLTNTSDDQIQVFIKSTNTPESLKAKLQEAMKLKTILEENKKTLKIHSDRIETINKDQDRLRKNIRELPKESKAFKLYLSKFDEQELEITDLQKQIKVLQKETEEQLKKYNDFLTTITIN